MFENNRNFNSDEFLRNLIIIANIYSQSYKKELCHINTINNKINLENGFVLQEQINSEQINLKNHC